MQHSASYNIKFATALCVVCAVIVSLAYEMLHTRYELNAALDKQRNVLIVSGLADENEDLSREEVEARISNIQTVIIDLQTGMPVTDIEPGTFDQRKQATNPLTSREAPDNRAQVQRLPEHVMVYEARGSDETLSMVVLPIEGMGLWSTLYGYIALDADLETILGLTFYEHRETPGLGGEVDNPRWKALWPGRRPFDENLQPVISVIKGRAGSVNEDPYNVDGLSGATITSRGVDHMLKFWLGAEVFGPYLQRIKQEREAS